MELPVHMQSNHVDCAKRIMKSKENNIVESTHMNQWQVKTKAHKISLPKRVLDIILNQLENTSKYNFIDCRYPHNLAFKSDHKISL